MAYKNNFLKMLWGQNVQGVISGAVAYTAQATFAAFQANAAIGELGVFDATTYALISGAGAASTTLEIFIAVARDTLPDGSKLIERTPSFKIGQVDMTRTAYSAPVKQITTITLGYPASLILQDITYIAKTPGTGGNAITVTNVVAGNNTALSIGVAGSAITVNIATNGGGAATSTSAQVVAAIIASGAASALVSAAVTGNTTTVQTAVGATNLAGGAADPVPTAGQIYEIGILETTPGNQPFPTYDYQYVSVAGDTIDTVAGKLVNMINSNQNYANSNRDLIITATFNTTTNVITLTAINFGVSFKAIVKYDLAPVSTIATPTPMHLGSGFPQQVTLLQDAMDIYKGVTTNYPLQGSNPADWGKPTDQVLTTIGYNLYNFTGFKDDISKTPAHRQAFQRFIMAAIPSTGTTPDAQLRNIFAL